MEHRFRKRRESMQWNCKYFISGADVDDGELFIPEEDVYDFKIDFMDSNDTRRHHTDMTISLLDIARPAKRKRKIFILIIFMTHVELILTRHCRGFRGCAEISKYYRSRRRF